MSFWKPTPRRIYADAAAATPMSHAARAEFLRVLRHYGNPSGIHKEGVEAKAELKRARQTIAAAIGAHPDEIVFVGSGTEANNLAIQGSFLEGSAVTTAIEHPSVLEPLRHVGLPVAEVGVTAEGLVEMDEFKKALTQDTTFVSVQLVNSEIGVIQPVREIAKIVRRSGTPLLHADAAQAPLWMDIKVERLGVDLLTLDGQKICSPKGVGALYIKRGTNIQPLLRGGGQEFGVRSGTENVAAACAFAVALREAQSGVEERAVEVAGVRDYLWSEIKNVIPEAILNGPPSGPARVANNLNISIPGLESQMAVVALDALGIAVSTRSACSAGEDEPSHVIAALGVPRELSGTAVRITLLPHATRAQAQQIAAALKEVANLYRSA